MSRVRIKSPGITLRQIDLKAGSTRFGRAVSNDFQIDHPSVSSNHCEIFVGNGSILLRDFGSTNGTFVKDQRIRETTLVEGQTFRLGSIELILESGSVSDLTQASSGKPIPCLQHPRIAATAECPKCKKQLCDFCVTTRVVTGTLKKFCRICRSECTFVNLRFTVPQSDDHRAVTLLVNALRYPIQRQGWVLLIGGSLLLFLIDMVAAGLFMGTPAMAAFALLFGVMALGYLFSFMQRIITTTAMGEQHMPGWPDFTEVWQDMIYPFRLLWGVFGACFGPALVCWYFASNGSDFAEQAQIPLVIAGFLYLPMALLGVAMSDDLASLNPLFVVASICKVPMQYVIACLLLGVIIGIKWAVEVAMAKAIPLFALRYLISAVVLLYFLVVEMRVLGLMYFWNRRKLGWM